MRKITIAYWHLTRLSGMPFDHKEQIDYSDKSLLTVIKIAMQAGYNSMIQKVDNNEVIVWIDKGRFGQR